MKWASSQISSIFPVSWFIKSKQKGGASQELGSSGLKQGSFYSMDEDDYFWSLSFGQQRRKSTGGINPLRYDDFQFQPTFNQMVSDMRQNRIQMKTGDSTQKTCRIFDDEEEVNKVQNSRNFEEKTWTLQERFSNSVSDWVETEGRKLKELKIKSESKKTSGVMMKSHSPGTECKIRALEKKKKKKSSRKKSNKLQVLEGSTIFDSFAVVKSSYNPHKDFRESMMEMIREREIQSAQDLQQLLACYLTLNCDEYHDVIINVFQQVWFQIKGIRQTMD